MSNKETPSTSIKKDLHPNFSNKISIQTRAIWSTLFSTVVKILNQVILQIVNLM